MNLTLKHAVAVIILLLGFATRVVAGPLEDADVAVKRHDYATTLRLIRPLAERGDASAQYILGFFYDNRPRTGTAISTIEKRVIDTFERMFCPGWGEGPAR
jgi:hypothetical protein